MTTTQVKRPGHQTFIVPCSTDNQSNDITKYLVNITTKEECMYTKLCWQCVHPDIIAT